MLRLTPVENCIQWLKITWDDAELMSRGIYFNESHFKRFTSQARPNTYQEAHRPTQRTCMVYPTGSGHYPLDIFPRTFPPSGQFPLYFYMM